MRQFVRTSVPTEKYQEVKKVGERYVCHFEPVEDKEVGVMKCYECIVAEEPDMEALRTDLATWKAYLAQKELELAKKSKVKEVLEYDVSPNVNSFTITKNGEKVTDYWIDAQTRATLGGAVRSAVAIGKTVYNFDVRELGITLPLNCEKFLAALNVLEDYACQSYNKTSQHIANINALESVEAVSEYDYTSGYPEKKTFEVTELY